MQKNGLGFISIAATAFRLTDGNTVQQFHQHRLNAVRPLIALIHHDLTCQTMLLAVLVLQLNVEVRIANIACGISLLVDVLAVLTALVADGGNALVGIRGHIHGLHPFFKRNDDGFFLIGDKEDTLTGDAVLVPYQLRGNDKTVLVKKADGGFSTQSQVIHTSLTDYPRYPRDRMLRWSRK